MASLELALLAPTDRVLFASDVAPPLRSRITLTATTLWQVAFPTLHTPVGELGAAQTGMEYKRIAGGLLVQDADTDALTAAEGVSIHLTLGGGLVDAAGRPIMVALAGCVCKFVFDSVPPRAELHARAAPPRCGCRCAASASGSVDARSSRSSATSAWPSMGRW
jgi:hypothetical protein